jgi:glycine reductase
VTYRIVHYTNQFFAGLGGEEKADLRPLVRPGAVGPAQGLEQALGGEAVVVATVICGDNYMAEHLTSATEEVLELIREHTPDAVTAGPAFNAGRYGTACGAVLEKVAAVLKVPVVSGMYPENPGVELYGRNVTLVKTGDSARGMKDALAKMAEVTRKLLRKEPLGPAKESGLLPRGIRRNVLHEKSGAERAVEMLLARLRQQPFVTEYPMPTFRRIPPAPPVADLRRATIALVSSGGVVPKGNPDRIRVSSAESYGAYDISALEDLTPENYESIHGGYDRVWANVDPDVVIPLDVMRALEREGAYGKLHPVLYTTTGTGTSVAHAERFGREIGAALKEAGVDAVILTST